MLRNQMQGRVVPAPSDVVPADVHHMPDGVAHLLRLHLQELGGLTQRGLQALGLLAGLRRPLLLLLQALLHHFQLLAQARFFAGTPRGCRLLSRLLVQRGHRLHMPIVIRARVRRIGRHERHGVAARRPLQARRLLLGSVRIAGRLRAAPPRCLRLQQRRELAVRARREVVLKRPALALLLPVPRKIAMTVFAIRPWSRQCCRRHMVGGVGG
mmetsp:Transcript_102168/g.286358  ORF Transcript_102168/g.286358 Transcript_102168/m.286358 type:complete len:212 (-) Transcript_102168:275-910(-)